ncbi:MAG: ectonucleotide pyrophosphatase/phosphodiesterase [Gemmatimonadota bacterium]
MIRHADIRRLAGAALLPFLVAGCSMATPLVYSSPQPVSGTSIDGYVTTAADATSPTVRTSDHVIVISIDGLRPDAIDRFGAKTLQRLAREGSYSFTARTIAPSVTLPSHTSMITGVGPRLHGVTWNDNRVAEEGRVTVPTILSIARARGYHTAAFASKGKFDHLMLPGSVNHAVLPAGNGKWLAGRTAQAVEDYFAIARPNLTFVHFGDPDYAGHTIGWMGRVYGWSVRRADGAVARVLDAADTAFGKGGYTVIVTADHGGHDRTHGTEADEDMTIPWIAWGKGVDGGSELTGPIHTTDTAATALWLLGIHSPAAYSGAPVLDAFETKLADRLQPPAAAR